MVGQVNGRPIFASEVFRELDESVLDRLGQTLPPSQFRLETEKKIVAHLRSRVFNTLILAEAERDLSDPERAGLQQMKAKQRDKLIARYGAGSLREAEIAIVQQTNLTLEQTLENWRQKLLIDRLKYTKLQPKVHVSRRDIERYYAQNHAEFNPPPSVTVRMILVESPAAADTVDAALAAGTPFAEVAQKHSIIRADQGGLLPTYRLKGPLDQFNELRLPALNEAVRTLKKGEHSPRQGVKIGSSDGFGWVMLEDLQTGEAKPLKAVYLQIENRLRNDQYDRLLREYYAQLLKEGNYTPLEEMVGRLLEIAVSRFSQPVQGS